MQVWIALLGAVNVSGVNRLPMEEFRTLLSGLGLGKPRTYIQSGNAVFLSDKNGPELANLIADAILARFGFRPLVLMLNATQLQAALAACPFAAEVGDKVLFVFAERDLPAATGDFLRSVAAPTERHAWRGKVIWLHLPGGIGRSRLAARVDALPVGKTKRNLNSVKAILALAARLAPAGPEAP